MISQLRTASRRIRIWRDGLALLPVLLAIAGLFGPTLLTDRNFAYRDVSHYYYPLFRWQREQILEGRLPLWNPLEDLGASSAADPTASLYYPLKIMLLLPVEFDFCFKSYVVIHFGLAAVAMFALVRSWHRSRFAAAIASLSYALGGNVLIQYANLPYLVGAAWLPLWVLALERLWKLPSRGRAFLLGAVWSMITLGGDIQLSYHLGLVAALYGCCSISGRLCRHLKGSWTSLRSALQRVVYRECYVALACVTMMCLSAVQVLPSYFAARDSTRGKFHAPRNIYEWGIVLLERADAPDDVSVSDGVLAVAPRDSHTAAVYDFSVGPWRWPELIWPAVGGRNYPENRRWMSGIPAEGRVWAPTLYLGLLPCLAALVALRFRRSSLRRRWLSWLALLAIVASLGQYGVVWLVHELLHSVDLQDRLRAGDPVGGLYWWLTVLLPSYVKFRYPAKWWVLAQFAAAALAGLGVDGVIQTHTKAVARLRQYALVVLGISAIGVPVVWYFAEGWMFRLITPRTDGLFGPLDVPSAASDTLAAMMHATVVAACVFALLHPRLNVVSAHRAWLLVSITTIELFIAQRWLVVDAPAALWHTPSALVQAVAGQHDDPGDARIPTRWFRGHLSPRWPRSWRSMGSQSRQQDAVAWERDSLYPKHQLLHDQAVLGSSLSMTRMDFATVMQQLTHRAGEVGVAHSSEMLQGLAVEAALSASDESIRQIAITGLVGEGQLYVSDLRAEREVQRAWLVDNWEWHPVFRGRYRGDWERWCRDIWFPADQFRDPHDQLVVETATMSITATHTPSDPTAPSPFGTGCTWLRYTPNELLLRVKATRPSMLVVAEQYEPGWQVEIRTDEHQAWRSAPLYRAHGAMRAVSVPQGVCEVRMRFVPQGWRAGAGVSFIAWALIAVACCRRRLRRNVI